MSDTKKVVVLEKLKNNGKISKEKWIKCKLCGSSYNLSNTNVDVYENVIRGNRCNHCPSKNVLSDTINPLLFNIQLSNNKKEFNKKNSIYFNNRIPTKNRVEMFKFMNAICINLDIVNVILSEDITLGLKNPMKKILCVEDFVLKSKNDDYIDRMRYFNPIERYEAVNIGRGEFKRLVKRQGYKFEDFNEVFFERVVFIGPDNKKRYTYSYNYFKKGDYIYESYQR